jgi:hypothetical protein
MIVHRRETQQRCRHLHNSTIDHMHDPRRILRRSKRIFCAPMQVMSQLTACLMSAETGTEACQDCGRYRIVQYSTRWRIQTHGRQEALKQTIGRQQRNAMRCTPAHCSAKPTSGPNDRARGPISSAPRGCPGSHSRRPRRGSLRAGRGRGWQRRRRSGSRRARRPLRALPCGARCDA